MSYSGLMSFQQAFPEIDVELTSTIKHVFELGFDPFDAVITYGKNQASNRLSASYCLTSSWLPSAKHKALPRATL